MSQQKGGHSFNNTFHGPVKAQMQQGDNNKQNQYLGTVNQPGANPGIHVEGGNQGGIVGGNVTDSATVTGGGNVTQSRANSANGVQKEPIDIVLSEEWEGKEDLVVKHCTPELLAKIPVENAYKMNKKPRGKMLLFNVNEVDGHLPRYGTEIDGKTLGQLFAQLHFDVEVWKDHEKYVINAEYSSVLITQKEVSKGVQDDLTAQAIEERTADFFRPMNHKGANAAVMAIFSHGGIHWGKTIIAEGNGRKISNLPTDYKNGEETDVELSGEYLLGGRSKPLKLKGKFRLRADERNTYLVAQHENNQIKVQDFIKDANGEKVYHSGEFVVGVDGKKVFLKTPFDMMNKCDELIGKPKIVIIQACRGGESEVGMAVPTDIPTDIPMDDKLLKESDSILLYATQPGMVSYRVPGYGSWFIQAIVKVFAEYAGTMDILSLKEKVNTAVAKYLTHKGTKQIPPVNSNLRKKLFFFPEAPPRSEL